MINGIILVFLDAFVDRVAPIEKTEEEKEEPPFKCNDMLKFSGQFWLINIAICLNYMTFIPYIEIISDLL